MVKCLLENSNEVALELNEVVNDIREKTIENLKSSVDMDIVIRVYKCENESEEILPDFLVFLVHASSDFDKKISELVKEILDIYLFDGGKKVVLEEVLSLLTQLFPESLFGFSDHCSNRSSKNYR
jgi:hypothetical protein